MKNALDMSRAYGVAIDYADLGTWGRAELRSEYDPRGPVIRINTRSIDERDPSEREKFIAHCVFHELYHHREAIGDVRRQRTRRAREDAAEAFARAMLVRQ